MVCNQYGIAVAGRKRRNVMPVDVRIQSSVDRIVEVDCNVVRVLSVLGKKRILALNLRTHACRQYNLHAVNV